jgi:hypothetical protein
MFVDSCEALPVLMMWKPRTRCDVCWMDEEISYELRVELLLVLQRLMEHFSTEVLSLQVSRSLDALRIILPGCMCAIGDSVIEPFGDLCTAYGSRCHWSGARNEWFRGNTFSVTWESFSSRGSICDSRI